MGAVVVGRRKIVELVVGRVRRANDMCDKKKPLTLHDLPTSLQRILGFVPTD